MAAKSLGRWVKVPADAGMGKATELDRASEAGLGGEDELVDVVVDALRRMLF